MDVVTLLVLVVVHDFCGCGAPSNGTTRWALAKEVVDIIFGISNDAKLPAIKIFVLGTSQTELGTPVARAVDAVCLANRRCHRCGESDRYGSTEYLVVEQHDWIMCSSILHCTCVAK